jgi:hypothetical protein
MLTRIVQVCEVHSREYLFSADSWTEENDWTDDNGEDDDMDYEPTTEGESEDMPDIFQQLLEAAEEDEDDDSDEFHGSTEHSLGNLLALTRQ